MAQPDLREQLDRVLAEKAALEQQLALSPPTGGESCKVSVKLPPFWPDKPAVWFAQVEAQFQIAGIVQESTKYNYVISQLDHRVAGEVDDIITSPPPKNQYSFLKTELIRRLSISEEQRIRQLLSDVELGDRKPSQFLRHLKSLGGSASPDQKFLRELWMRRLPQNIQAILTSQSDLDLDKLADLADKIIELSGPSSSVFCTSSAPMAIAPPTDLLQDLTAKVAELTKQVSALSSRSRSVSRDDSRQSSRSSSPSSSKRCWYHRRFGHNAKKCILPCDWNVSENSKNNQ